MWECPCVDYVPNIFGVKADFGMEASHIFPQDVLAIVPLIGVVVVVIVSRTCAGCKVGTPLSVCHHPVGTGSAPQLLE